MTDLEKALQSGGKVVQPEENMTDLQKALSAGGKVVGQPTTPPPAPAVGGMPGKGWGSRVATDIGKRVGGIGTALTEPIKSMTRPTEEAGYLEAIPQRALRAGGQGLAALGDIAGETAKSLYKTITPEPVQKGIQEAGKSILDTEIGQTGLKALQAGGEAYGKFKTAYPELAKDVEAAVQITAGVPIVKGGYKLAETGIKTIAEIPSKIAPSANVLKKEIEYGIKKGVKPYVSPKGQTAKQAEQYYQKAQDAVESIIENKPTLKFTDDMGEIITNKLPQNLQEFHSAIGQTKKTIFDKYDSLAKQAGKQGVTVELAPIANELDSIATNKVLATEKPEVVKYAMAKSKAYKEIGAYTASEAQEAISALNNSLESFYKNPSYDTWSKAYIDSLAVNNLRKSLDDIIEKTTEGGYQALKNQYGALKSIERDVSRRAVTDARKNVKGLVENLSDVSSGATAVYGLLHMNPQTLIAAGTAKGLAAWRAKLLDPNRIISKMFERSEKIIEKRASPYGKRFIGPIQPKGASTDYSSLSDSELHAIAGGK